MKVFLSAGHNPKNDSGVIVSNFKEADLMIAIRDKVKDKMPDLECPSDDLTLRQTIDWINGIAQPDDLAIEIHANSHSNNSVKGVEAYYVSDPTLANYFSKEIAKNCSLTNLGAKRDTDSYVGSLGFLRYVKCRSVLIELCYLTNFLDRSYITSPKGQDEIAEALVKAIKGLTDDKDKIIAEQKTLIETLKRILKEVMNFDWSKFFKT